MARLLRRLFCSKSEDLAYRVTDASVIGPNAQDLQTLTQMTAKPKDAARIFGVLHDRFVQSPKNWRQKSKALTVLQYFLIHGGDPCLKWIKDNRKLLQQLKDHKSTDASGRDQSKSVRDKARGLLYVIADPERIEQTRANYAAQREDVRKSIGTGRPSTQSRNTLELMRESLFDDPDPTDLNGAFQSAAAEQRMSMHEPEPRERFLSAIAEEH